MGVKHLWSILEPACKQGSYDDLAGKTAAVDLSIWIIESRSVSTTNHRNSLHLRYTNSFICSEFSNNNKFLTISCLL